MSINRTFRKQQKLLNRKILSDIIAGDFTFINLAFFSLYSKGSFYAMQGCKSYAEIKMWADDVAQEVFITLYLKHLNGTIADIKYPKAFIRKIILNKTFDENKRLEKFMHIDLLKNEKLN